MVKLVVRLFPFEPEVFQFAFERFESHLSLKQPLFGARGRRLSVEKPLKHELSTRLLIVSSKYGEVAEAVRAHRLPRPPSLRHLCTAFAQLFHRAKGRGESGGAKGRRGLTV